MCTDIMVCHGDFDKHIDLTEEQKKKLKNDCKPAPFYITEDGKYAVHADFVDVDDLKSIDLDKVPKIKIK